MRGKELSKRKTQNQSDQKFFYTKKNRKKEKLNTQKLNTE